MLNLSYICGFFKDMKEIFYVSLAIGLAIVLIWLMIKFESARWFVGCISTFVLIAGAIFSGVKLDKYYNTSGGIYGELTSIFQPSKVEIEDKTTNKVTFDFTNVKMLQDEEDNSTYIAEFTTKKYIALSEISLYGVFVNGLPCDVIDYQEDYILADYYYLFEDEELEPIMQDTLSFRFVFYNNQTRLIVKTSGGEDAVKLWNSYFANESFLVTIEKNYNAYYFTENYVRLEFYENENLVNAVKLPRNTSYLLPKAADTKTGYFIGWTDSKGNFYTDKITSLTNVKLYATYEDFVNVRFHLNIDEIDTNSNLFSNYLSKKDVSLLLPEKEPVRYGFEFVGWSLDGQNVVNLDSYIVNADITFYAVWEQIGLYVNISNEDATLMINNQSFSNDTTQMFLYDTPIVLKQPTKDGYKHFRYVFSRYNLNADMFESVIVTKTNFNVTLNELILKLDANTSADPEEPSYTPSAAAEKQYYYFIEVQYLRDSENLAYFTDLDLIESLYKIKPYERYEYYSHYNWLVDYCRDIYYMCNGYVDYDMSNVDLFQWFVDVAELDYLVTEDGEPRELIELIYNNEDVLIEKGFVVSREFKIIGD